jgi:hypothetical protein
VAIVVVVIVGAVVWIAKGSSSTGDVATGGAPNGSAPPGSASGTPTVTAAPGVTATSIQVVFPVVSLNSLAGKEGFATDTEYGQQENAINTFVNDINAKGGINGRKIDPKIVQYDPTDEAGMRSLCKDWTQGSSPAFAVLDGIGAWEGDNELCITQEGHTPMISQWTTVSSWTQQGAPYLWWTGVDQTVMIDTMVKWASQAGLIGANQKVGILAGDRAADQAALNQALLPALKDAGVTDPVTATIPANADAAQATIAAKAPQVVQQFRDAGVTSVIPLIPFNAFFPYLQAETDQEYFPKLVLSDYESSIQAALGLIPVPYEKALDGQQGVTALTLGDSDYPGPADQGGYNAGMQGCYDTWKAANAPPAPPDSPYLEAQGPVAAWCQVIRLFAQAATQAGPNLNHQTFTSAMAGVQNFAGTYSPILSYGTTKYYGPTQYRVVKLFNNDPPSPDCKPTWEGKAQGTCWVVTQNWQPLVTS